MRKPHRKQRLAWLLTAAFLLTHLPISVLSEEIIENPIQTEIVEQDEPETTEEPNLSDFPTEEPDEPIEPPVSEEPNETPEPSEPSGTMEIPADENTPDIPDQDESETPEPSDSDIEETPSPGVPEETEAPDADSTDEPPAEEVPAEETPVPEESPLPDDEESFSVSEALLEYGYAYAVANAESVIYEDADLTAPLSPPKPASSRPGIYVYSGYGLAELRTFPAFYLMPEARKCSARYCVGVFPVFSRKTDVK